MTDFDVVVETTPQEYTVETTQTLNAFDVTVEVGFLGPQGLPGETVLSYVAGQDISSLFVVKLNSNAEAVYASCKDPSSFLRVIGITQNAALVGGSLNVRKYGVISDPTWNWDLDKNIFLGEDGRLVQYPDISGAVFVQSVGYPINSTSMFVNLNTPITIL